MTAEAHERDRRRCQEWEEPISFREWFWSAPGLITTALVLLSIVILAACIVRGQRKGEQQLREIERIEAAYGPLRWRVAK